MSNISLSPKFVMKSTIAFILDLIFLYMCFFVVVLVLEASFRNYSSGSVLMMMYFSIFNLLRIFQIPTLLIFSSLAREVIVCVLVKSFNSTSIILFTVSMWLIVVNYWLIYKTFCFSDYL